MASKSNIRSMRFSDQIIEMIEAQVGDTFTAKFENLVTRCMWELPEKEKQLEQITKHIENERKRLQDLSAKRRELENTLYELDQNMKHALRHTDRIIGRLNEM